MDFGFENIMDFTIDIDNLDLANSMVFGFEKIMDFTMNIEKLNLANLVWGR